MAANEEVEQGQDPIYGYDKVIVSGVKPDADTRLVSKSITANGTYKVADEPADTSGKKPYGYSTVHVNVKGGGKYTDPDTGEVVRPDPSSDPGSTIVGTNPDTGNEEARTVDDNGQLKTLELASYIQLDTPPTKTEYRDGERIMMGGAVAHGYKQDGTPYKGTLAASELPWHQYEESESSEYSEDFLPGGIVFEMPLYADISKASGESGRVSPIVDGKVVVVDAPILEYWNDDHIDSGASWYVIKSGSAVGAITLNEQQTSSRITWASTEPFVYGVPEMSGGTNSQPYTYNGKTVYYGGSQGNYWNHGFNRPVSTEIDPSSTTHEKLAWTMIYGEAVGGTQTITLTWPREGDRKHLQTTYEITVTE